MTYSVALFSVTNTTFVRDSILNTLTLLYHTAVQKPQGDD